MININSNKTLSIILPNTNRALKEILSNASPDELEQLSKNKDLKSILDSLLVQTSKDTSKDKLLLNLLKNSPTFKNLGDVNSTLKDLQQLLQKEKEPLPLEKKLTTFLSDIKDISEKGLKTKIENSGIFLENRIKNLQSPAVTLKNLMQELSKNIQNTKLDNVKMIDKELKNILSSNLFKNISNSDILKSITSDLSTLTQMSQKIEQIIDKLTKRLNSPLDKSINPTDALFSKNVKDIIQKLTLINKPEQLQTQTMDKLGDDLKALLLKTKEEISTAASPNKAELLKQIDKLSMQIDYHQLVSHLSNASSLYIPYSWDALEDGNITIKNAKDGKFFTDIELQLKEFGLLKLRLGLFEDKQLNINISTKNENFKNILKENMPQLKKQLFDVGIMPMNIRFLDDNDALTNSYSQSTQNLDSGFEVKA